MSIHHSKFCELVEQLAAGEPPSDDDLALLREYAEPVVGIEIEDQLGGSVRELVEELTGRGDVWSPPRAARALLASMNVA